MKNLFLGIGRTSPELIIAGPPTKEQKVQYQSPNVKQTITAHGLEAATRQTRATTTEAIKRWQGQGKECGSRLGRSAQDGKRASKTRRKLCAGLQNPTWKAGHPLEKRDLRSEGV